MDTDTRVQRINAALEREIETIHVEVEDLSSLHAGHPGARSGGGHYRVLVVSPRFRGLGPVAAQRLVYQAVGAMMESEIHAMEMRTLTPEQWQDE